MASIANDPGGKRRVQFMAPDGTGRKSIRLGKVSKRDADSVKFRVESLLASQFTGNPIDADTAIWVANLGPELSEKLAAVGLIQSREIKAAATLGEFLASFISERQDVKPATVATWKQGERALLEFFGPGHPLESVTPGDADRFKQHLLSAKKASGDRIAPATANKRLQFACLAFRAAHRRRLISENPFFELTIKSALPDRMHFITPENTRKLLDACPDYRWRSIVALARYGGLRCPSEVLTLRWQDIDWEAGRMMVKSPKTEHHAGHDCRAVPLFPELRAVLTESFEQSPEGAVCVVDDAMLLRAQGAYGWKNCNLRTTFNKIVKRAGLKPWPRLFHNLRSSRQTELSEQFPEHVVCAWIGNSKAIARRHYLQTTDEHFAKAIQGGAESGALPAQNRAQPMHAGNGGESHQERVSIAEKGTYAVLSDTRRSSAQVFNGDDRNRTCTPFGTRT